MSRIGKLPISIPAGVTVNFDEKTNVFTVKGPKGELSQEINPSIKPSISDGQITFEVDEKSPVDYKQKQRNYQLIGKEKCPIDPKAFPVDKEKGKDDWN